MTLVSLKKRTDYRTNKKRRDSRDVATQTWKCLVLVRQILEPSMKVKTTIVHPPPLPRPRSRTHHNKILIAVCKPPIMCICTRVLFQSWLQFVEVYDCRSSLLHMSQGLYAGTCLRTREAAQTIEPRSAIVRIYSFPFFETKTE